MTLRTFITRRKHNVELNSEKGSTSIIILGIILFIILLIILFNIIDYSLYSNKKNIIQKSLDFSVTAAIQEVDTVLSKEGLSQAYSSTTGEIQLKSIYINEIQANNAFYSTFTANTDIARSTIEKNSLIVIVNPQQSSLQYTMQSRKGRNTGAVATPEQLETAINNKLEADSLLIDGKDKHIINVNDNLKTVEFKERPYYLVIIRNLPVKGLFRTRDTTFVAFRGANIERNVEN